MRAWALLLGGMIVWTVQFFTLYGIASVFLTTLLARILVGAVTLACLVADAMLLMLSMRRLRQPPADALDRWMLIVAALVAGLSLVAVLWQGLPALLI